MPRNRSQRDRAAWTAWVESGGTQTTADAPRGKYGNRRSFFNGKWYASKREADVAAKLQPLAERGLIKDYQEQKRITLVPGDGKMRPIVYVCDYYYVDLNGVPHVLDAKGFRTADYRLKKRLAALLLHIEIEEV